MKASVKLTIDRIAISNRVRVGDTPYLSFHNRKGKLLKPIFKVAEAGATEEVAFSLLKNRSHSLHTHMSDFMLGSF